MFTNSKIKKSFVLSDINSKSIGNSFLEYKKNNNNNYEEKKINKIIIIKKKMSKIKIKCVIYPKGKMILKKSIYNYKRI